MASTESIRSTASTDEETDPLSSRSSFSGPVTNTTTSRKISSSSTSVLAASILSPNSHVPTINEKANSKISIAASSSLASSSATKKSMINDQRSVGRLRSNSAFAIMEGTRLAAFEKAEEGNAGDVAPCDLSVSIPIAQLRRMVVDSSGRRNRSNTITSDNNAKNVLSTEDTIDSIIGTNVTNDEDMNDDDFLSCCSWDEVESGAAFVMAATMASQSALDKRSRAYSTASCTSTSNTLKSSSNDPILQQFSKLALAIDV